MSDDPHQIDAPGAEPEEPIAPLSRRDRAATEPGGFKPTDMPEAARLEPDARKELPRLTTRLPAGSRPRPGPAVPPAPPAPPTASPSAPPAARGATAPLGLPPSPPPAARGATAPLATEARPKTSPRPAPASRRPPSSDPFSVHGVRSPLVGRSLERQRLLDVVEAATDFHSPQLVTILGNQGTGKSRLVDELVEQVREQGVRVFSSRATEGGPRYEPVVRYLRGRFDLPESLSEEEGKARLERQIAEIFAGEPVAEVVHFIGHYLDLHFPDSPLLRVLGENPGQHDEIARTVLRRLIEVDAESGPMVLVFDDLQWADDDSLALLAELGARLGGSAVVVIACARPELLVRFSDWGAGATDHHRIDLRNLAPDDAEAMFGHLLARCDEVPEDVVFDAVEMTGGNPHFLEQLVRLFHGNGTIDSSGPTWKLDADRAAATELPISIEEAIEARIAALETTEREVLEKGAVFGNVFWLGAVVALSRMEGVGDDGESLEPPDDPLQVAWEGEPLRKRIEIVVDDLVDRDYLLRLEDEDSTVAGDVELVFKHNLERELVAHSTETSRLERYHRLAAQWLESKLLARSEEQLEFLAQLYERGGDRRRAAHCFLAGGDKARARYANEQAIELYRRGLATLGDDEPVTRLDALHNLGTVLVTMGKSEEAREQFREMLRWAWKVDHQAKGGAAHNRLGRIDRARGDYDAAMAHLERANQLFQRAGDQRGMASTLDDIGRVHWLRGSYERALDCHRQALAIRRAIGDRRSIALSLANIGRVHHDQGGFKAAHRQFREALDLRRDIGDLSGVVESLCDLGGVHTADGAFVLALEMLGEAYQIAQDIGDKLAQCEVLARMGEAKSKMGDGTAAVEHLMEAISIAAQLGHRAMLGQCRARLAEVYVAMGDSGQAADQAQRAKGIGESIGRRVLVGTCERILGESLAMSPGSPEDLSRAEGHFRAAVDILAEMKNELGLARTYRSFGQLVASVGRDAEAAQLNALADEIYARLHGAAATD